MNTGNPKHEHKPEQSVSNAIRRILGFKALRTMRDMVDEIEQEEATSKKALRVLLLILPIILILAAALFIWFRQAVSIQQF